MHYAKLVLIIILLVVFAPPTYAQMTPTTQTGEPIERNILWNTLIKKLQTQSELDLHRLEKVRALLLIYEQMPEHKQIKEWSDVIKTWHSLATELEPKPLVENLKIVGTFMLSHEQDAVLRVSDLTVNEAALDAENSFGTMAKLTETLQKQLELFGKQLERTVPKESLTPQLKELQNESITALKAPSKNFSEYQKLMRKIRKSIEKD